jgi:hypothetical protein
MNENDSKPIRPCECGDCEHFRVRPGWLGCTLVKLHWRNLFECPLGLIKSNGPMAQGGQHGIQRG